MSDTQDKTNGETMRFEAEVGRLLDIVANALYSEREIFLRELISNAADACDRLRYDALSDESLLEGQSDFHIQLSEIRYVLNCLFRHHECWHCPIKIFCVVQTNISHRHLTLFVHRSSHAFGAPNDSLG